MNNNNDEQKDPMDLSKFESDSIAEKFEIMRQSKARSLRHTFLTDNYPVGMAVFVAGIEDTKRLTRFLERVDNEEGEETLEMEVRNVTRENAKLVSLLRQAVPFLEEAIELDTDNDTEEKDGLSHKERLLDRIQKELDRTDR